MPSDPEILFSGKFLEMLRSGRWEYAHRKGNVSAVGIIAVTPEGRLLLVEQYRIPVNTRTIELPAGLVGDEQGAESVELAAQRELLEETGYQAGKVEYLFDGPSSAGMTDEQVHLVLATDLRRQDAGGGVAGEQIIVHEVELADLGQFLAGKRRAGVQIDFKVRLAGCLMRSRR